MCIGLFLHLPVDGYLDYFQFGVIMKKAAINLCLQVFVWTSIFFFLGKMPKGGIAGHMINENLTL